MKRWTHLTILHQEGYIQGEIYKIKAIYFDFIQEKLETPNTVTQPANAGFEPAEKGLGSMKQATHKVEWAHWKFEISYNLIFE